MRKIIFGGLLIFLINSVFSQTLTNSFKIVNNQHPEQESFYVASIEKANMESYRLQNKDVTVHFENGFDCVFMSAKTLFLKGKQINPITYQEIFLENFKIPVFNIISSGRLVAIFPINTKKYK